ncbi:MAG: TonB-dependent receptor [Gemmatimonadota bacterium]|nr:TonB-dependent receptor [Gemmatimonadota bacterium]
MHTHWIRGVACALGLAVPAAIAAQGAARSDSARADSARRLGQVRVTVTRTETTAERAPWAIATQERGDLTRGQATIGIDEALNNIPGVIVSNRYNWSVDQRLSIRGAGARANFGIRGVKILLDGVPQSLPDGQNQMTNVDLGAVSRVEVLRGSASSLYGNGSGGVIAFESDRSAPDKLGMTARFTGGSFGMSKAQLRGAGQIGSGTGSLALSRTRVVGSRMYDTAEVRQSIATFDYPLAERRTLEVRASYADSPVSRNPGALTAAEYAKNRDSASAFNIARGSNKWLSQTQLSARVIDRGDRGDRSFVAYVQRRFVDNPLATAPPGTTGMTIGTLSTLNRWVTGARADAGWNLTTGERPMRIQGGVDLQRSFDIRRNWRATGGKLSAATDTLYLDQGESVIAAGPFVGWQWSPAGPLTLSAGTRLDKLWFDVSDNFLRDNRDNSGSRTMTAASAHGGASWVFGSQLTAYANVASAFETPTTTELSSRQDGTGGFNPGLGPQHVRSMEAGVRGAAGRFTYTATMFRSTYADAIVQFLESNGRAYFRNAGESRNTGLEAGATARVASWLDVNVAWTESRFRFTNYIASRTATIKDTLDGKRVAGVPDRFYRIGLKSRFRAFSADVDRTWSGDLFGDDRNLVRVEDWGNGAVNARLSWSGKVGGAQIAPFAAVNNALNVAYVSAVTVNGANGRVLEPAPLRNYYLGMEMGWRVVR